MLAPVCTLQPLPLLSLVSLTPQPTELPQQDTCEPQDTAESFLKAGANPAEPEPTAGETVRANTVWQFS